MAIKGDVPIICFRYVMWLFVIISGIFMSQILGLHQTQILINASASAKDLTYYFLK